MRSSLRVDQLADADARAGGVVGDDGEVALALPHQLVHQAFGRADAHEAADHEVLAPLGIMRDGLLEGHALHVFLR